MTKKYWSSSLTAFLAFFCFFSLKKCRLKSKHFTPWIFFNSHIWDLFAWDWSLVSHWRSVFCGLESGRLVTRTWENEIWCVLTLEICFLLIGVWETCYFDWEMRFGAVSEFFQKENCRRPFVHVSAYVSRLSSYYVSVSLTHSTPQSADFGNPAKYVIRFVRHNTRYCCYSSSFVLTKYV